MNDGTTALPVSPVQTEEDTMKLASFFNSLAEKVVQASTLPKQLEQTQHELDGLKHDFEAERNHSTMLDQQLLDMRNQRNAAEDELAKVRQELEETKRAYGREVAEHGSAKDQLARTREDYTRVVHERDDSLIHAMQLEEDLGKTKDTLKHFKERIAMLLPDPEPAKPEAQPVPQQSQAAGQAQPSGSAPTSGPSSPEPMPSGGQEPHPVQATEQAYEPGTHYDQGQPYSEPRVEPPQNNWDNDPKF